MSSTGPKKKSTTFTSGPRGSKVKKSILIKSKYDIQIPIIRNGVNVTPIPLDPLMYDSGLARLSTIETISSSHSSSPSVTKFESMQQLFRSTTRKSYTIHLHDDIYLESEAASEEAEIETLHEEITEPTLPEKTPVQCNLVLNETNTIFLLDLPSSTVLKGTEEGDAAEEDNKTYEYLTVGKGRNRKVVDVAVQTIPFLKKTRDTTIFPTQVKNNGVFVSVWDMFDSFIEEENAPLKPKLQRKISHHKLIDSSLISSKNIEEEFLKQLEKNERFMEAVNIIERLLANNEYGPAQKRYKDLIRPNYLDSDLKYNYKLNLLWTFRNEITKGKCVVSIDINKSNNDVIAVGYGRFNYHDPTTTGMVMIWNIKNPTQPERHYDFEESVTALVFSNKFPNLLAVGFFNGKISILDTSSRSIREVRRSNFGESPSLEPILHLVCCQSTENEKDEWLLASFADGRVCKYQITESRLKCTEISRTAKVEGQLKGIKSEIRECPSGKTAVTRYTPASTVVIHPEEKATYFVGTGEGVIHRCSMNYLDRHLDVFQAHDGNIVTMKFSPFLKKIFLTAGDDAISRLWVDGLFEPILDNRLFLNVIYDIAWSTSHSTIYCVLRDTNITIWDLQRRHYRGLSHTLNPNGVSNTVVKFSESGTCLIVGDMDGNVNVFALEELPIPPFFQENLLKESLKRIVLTQPELLRKFSTLGI